MKSYRNTKTDLGEKNNRTCIIEFNYKISKAIDEGQYTIGIMH